MINQQTLSIILIVGHRATPPPHPLSPSLLPLSQLPLQVKHAKQDPSLRVLHSLDSLPGLLFSQRSAELTPTLQNSENTLESTLALTLNKAASSLLSQFPLPCSISFSHWPHSDMLRLYLSSLTDFRFQKDGDLDYFFVHCYMFAALIIVLIVLIIAWHVGAMLGKYVLSDQIN